jgi:hypothetical protein
MDILERIKQKLDTLPEGYDSGDIGDIIGRAIMEDLLESKNNEEQVTDTIDAFYSGLHHGFRFYDTQL